MANHQIDNPDAIAHALFDLCRDVGLERGFDLSARLIYVCWELQAEADGQDHWRQIVESSPQDQEMRLLYVSRQFLSSAIGDLGELENHLRFRSLPASFLPSLLSIVNLATQLPDPRAVLAASFEALLLNPRLSDLGMLGIYGTPSGVAALMASVVGDPKSVLDPVCGFGSTLLAFGPERQETSLHGVDISAQAVSFATMRTRMAGVEASVELGDIFQVAVDHIGRYDAVVMHPPWGVTFSSEAAHSLKLLGIDNDSLPRSATRSDLMWVELAVRLLRPGGRAAVLLPQIASQHSEEVSRLIGRVESVISFPPKFLPGTSSAGALWILGDEHRSDHQVLLVDGSTFLEPAYMRQLSLSKPEAERLARVVHAFRGSSQTTV